MELASSQNQKQAWLSGEICENRGLYFSDVCGHKIVKELRIDDVFPRCPTCFQAVRWMRYRGFGEKA